MLDDTSTLTLTQPLYKFIIPHWECLNAFSFPCRTLCALALNFLR